MVLVGGVRRVHRALRPAHRAVGRRTARRWRADLISRLEQRDYLGSVEWETLLFFAGLFIMVGALVKTGVVGDLARSATECDRRERAADGDADPRRLRAGVGHHRQHPVRRDDDARSSPSWPPPCRTIAHPDALWWALALGADFGGNLTAVGASANVVMLGIARRADNPISFWEFTRKGAVVTAVSIALSAIYLWLRYFVWG